MRERVEPGKAVLSLGGLSVQELARRVVREIQQDDCLGRAAHLSWWKARSTPKLNTRRPMGKILAKKRHHRPLLCAVAQPCRGGRVDMPVAVQDTLVAPLERVGMAWNDVHRIT
jgi:hypothetical protein